MTDKQLDELLRKAMQPTEMPPELPMAAPRRSSRKKAWMGLAAACLCLVASAAVFHSGNFIGITSKKSSMDYNNASSMEAPQMPESTGRFPEILTGDCSTDPDAALPEPGFTLDTASPLYLAAVEHLDSGDVHFYLLGETEAFVSIAAETEGQTAFFTMEKQTQCLVDLAYLLSIPGMEFVISPLTEPDRFTQTEIFYIDENGELRVLTQ